MLRSYTTQLCDIVKRVTLPADMLRKRKPEPSEIKGGMTQITGKSVSPIDLPEEPVCWELGDDLQSIQRSFFYFPTPQIYPKLKHT